uniref:Uncharacterized protein n=1 Tax=Paramormyrops kingsleyae TaxID=1676925 RepID=A0A3B3T2E4_9TELE
MYQTARQRSLICHSTEHISTYIDRDIKPIMQPYGNWVKYLVPAPDAIAILGVLVRISNNLDFSINKNPPKDGFQYIKYPDSFSACLMEVVHSGWAAFNEAHKNMDQIRLHTGNVPAYIERMLLQDSDEWRQKLLPVTVEDMSSISDECVKLADETEKKFTFVINLIQELLEACKSAKKVYGSDLENVERKCKELEIEKEASNLATERAQKMFDYVNEQVAAAEINFDEAIKKVPSGWKVFSMNLSDAFIDGMLTILSLLTRMTAKSRGQICNVNVRNTIAGSQDATDESEDTLAMCNILTKAILLLKLTETLNSFIDKEEIKWSEIYDENENMAKTLYLGEQYNQVKTSVESEKNCKAKKVALDICTDAIKLCSELTEIAPEGKCDAVKTKAMIGRMQSLLKRCQIFDCENKAFTITPVFTPEPPQQAVENAHFLNFFTPEPPQQAVENAHFCIEQRQAQLDKVRVKQQESLENLEKNQKELTEILTTLENCKVKEVDFKTTIDMLVKYLDAMGREWEKIVRFFQMISNTVKTCLDRSLKFFSKQSQNLSQKDRFRLITDMVMQALLVTSFINKLSETYFNFSEKHLMDTISILGKPMGLDPASPDFEREYKIFRETCKKAEDAINELMMDEQRNLLPTF